MSWNDTTDELFDAKVDFPKFSPGALVRYIAVDDEGDDQGESIGLVVDHGIDRKAGCWLDVEHLGSSDEYYAWWISDLVAKGQKLIVHICLSDRSECKFV